jgi:hypothetical protein
VKTAIATLKSMSPYSQSRHYEPQRQADESHDDHYRRTWREHIHVDENGMAFIPPMAFKNCLSEAAKFLSMSVPGKGKATYTKNFEAGVLVVEPLSLGVHKDKVDHECLFLPSDGQRGSGKRINKYYPIFHNWSGDVEFMILDETVLHSMVSNKEMTVFEHVLKAAGSFIGIGRFRPKQNGFYGRFEVEGVAIV